MVGRQMNIASNNKESVTQGQKLYGNERDMTVEKPTTPIGSSRGRQNNADQDNSNDQI